MRLFHSLPALALLLGARASVHRARDDDHGPHHDPHDNDVLELLDVCAYIEADINERLNIVDTAGHAQLGVLIFVSKSMLGVQRC
jgi:hypothetical protein